MYCALLQDAADASTAAQRFCTMLEASLEKVKQGQSDAEHEAHQLVEDLVCFQDKQQPQVCPDLPSMILQTVTACSANAMGLPGTTLRC